jgi:dihydrolipoamide dehydrogenase
MKNFDLVVIGGGPGGYVAAIRAAQLGMKVALVEQDKLGGICLNWGCIPTKALLKSAEVYHTLRHAEEFGFHVKEISFDFDKIIKRSRDISKQLASGIVHLMKKNNITVYYGHGMLAPGKKIRVKDTVDSTKTVEELSANNIIIATGARARTLPGLETDGKRVMNYKDALQPTFFPKRLLVVGSGAIGIEFASFYQNMGASVTIVEVADRILRLEDEEISEFMKREFESQGMKIYVSSKVVSLKRAKDTLTAEIETQGGKKDSLTFDAAIVAVGTDGNVQNLGLEQTKIKVEQGRILTNEWCETNESGIYAIGDVTGSPWLAHKASHEGVICAEKIAGLKDVRPLNKNAVPSCIYGMPQVASVGMTEKQAQNAGLKIKVGKFPFLGNGKAIAIGQTQGFIKTIYDADTQELLGVHMVGADVTELIQGYAIAMASEVTAHELMHTIFPHPTLSEVMHESVLQAFDKAIHI